MNSGLRNTDYALRDAEQQNTGYARRTTHDALRTTHYLLALLLFVLALAPRALALGDFVTIDEASKWFGRSEGFLHALQTGDYARTNQTGHPGVTTMWLGSAGVLLHQSLSRLGWIAPDDLTTYRILLRLPVAIVTALSVALGYLLLRRLLDGRVALLGALFWASEPFLVAHGQVLHLDGLLTAWMTLALLAAMAGGLAGKEPRTEDREPRTEDRAAPGTGHRAPGSWYLVGSAVAGGLAFLTKSPAVILLPMVSLVVLISTANRETSRRGGRDWLRVLRSWFLVLCTWCGIALLVWVALWPAVWVDAAGAITSVVNEVLNNGGAPHNTGNFFFGQTVDDPGPLFYPVATILHLTPWTLLGLLLALVLPLARLRRPGQHPPQNRPAALASPQTATLALLVVFVLLFTIFMSIPPKKFDRYVLPIFPALDILAAAGWIWLVDWLRQRMPHAAQRLRTGALVPAIGAAASARRRQFIAWGAVVVGLVTNLGWYHPYIFAYYNPLLGGGPVAARTIPVGWGEGYEQAGAFISAQFNGCVRPVASWFIPVMRHFVCTEVVPLSEIAQPGKVGYAVLYIDQLQRNNEPAAIDQLYGKQPPVHTVQIHGITYAYVYQLAPPVTHPVAADFGPAIRLRGYDLDTAAVQASNVVTLTLEWEARAPLATDQMLFVHLLDATGNRVAQIDVPPGGQPLPTSIWQPDRYVSLVQPIPLPANLPAGSYWLALGIYDPQTFARLPLQGPTPPAAPFDGTDALLIGPLALP